MIPAVRKIMTRDQTLSLIQEAILNTLNRVTRSEILDGVVVEDIALVSGTALQVEHGLGREPVGYLVIGKSANANIWDTARDGRFITLNTSANATIAIWVF